jgi:hypothetical protein
MSTNPNPNPTPNPNPNPQPKKRKKQNIAFADLLQEWDALLGAVTDHGSALSPVDPHRTALADILQKIKQAKVLQDSHRATKQRTTQQLKELLVEGKDRAARLRGAVRAEMGTGNEQLVQFGIHPVRRRVTRSQQSATATATPPLVPELQETKTGKGVQ